MAANVVFLIVGYILFANILPPYAKNQAGVSERAIGFVFLVNTVFIVLVALPIGHAVVRHGAPPARSHVGGVGSRVLDDDPRGPTSARCSSQRECWRQPGSCRASVSAFTPG